MLCRKDTMPQKWTVLIDTDFYIKQLSQTVSILPVPLFIRLFIWFAMTSQII